MFRRWLATVFFLGAVFSANAAETPTTPGTQTITLAGGCFWCMEAVFDELKGVTNVDSGYAGGRVVNPSYEQVSEGTTGHAESVQITFDPSVICLDTVLKVFFTIHDPTTVDRQGNDVGEQYRSVAFYRDAGQKAAIDKAIAAAASEWNGKIVTQVVPFSNFYKAENYHQEYFKLHGTEPYCQLVVAPKVAKFRKVFHDQLK
jgi:peptide-methionine (S)-S-oxide reductase